jgi:hypothetical protein
MSAPRIVLLYEDKTVGGIHRLLEAIVTARRNAEGLHPFPYFKALPMKGNSLLVKSCEDFEKFRFYQPYKADHIFALIDAYEVEKVVPNAPPPMTALNSPSEGFVQYTRELEARVREHMCSLAFGKMTDEKRTQEEARFHPSVIFWELESIFLAGAETLQREMGLVFPEERRTTEGILYTRHPTKIVEEAWRAANQQSYSKANTGFRLFDALLHDSEAWPAMLERLPSFARVIDELLEL